MPKNNNTTQKRITFNTTIDSEILNEFKKYCKERGFAMNTVLEIFMKQLINEEFVLRIDKVNCVNIDTNNE